MSSSFKDIHSHSLAGPNGTETVSQALEILRPFLPVSLHIYRRLQIGRFFQETVLLTNLPSLHLPSSSGHDEEEEEWYLAFLDRTSRPETQFWIFGSWEANSSSPTTSQKSFRDDLIKALLQKIKTLPLPESHHQEFLDAEAARSSFKNNDADEKDSFGRSRSQYTSHIHNDSIILLGAVHEKTAESIFRMGLNEWERESNHTYIFSSLPDSLPETRNLPEGLHWGQLQYSDFTLVRSRTQIPRQSKTLAILPHLAILTRDNTPVAWAFVGIDGSLTTLHVEAEYRGQGLARAITVKLFKEKMEHLWEHGVEKMAHGYVMVGNDASSAVCTGLGGTTSWKVYWLRVDLTKV